MSWIADILLWLVVFVAILILLLVWMILVPRHFWLEYCKQDGLIIQMNIAFLKIRLFPLPDFVAKSKLIKKKSLVDNDTNAVSDTDMVKTKDKKNFSVSKISFELIKDILGSAKGIMKRVLKAIKFSHVSFTVPVYGGRAEETQKKYAGITSAFYTFNIFLQQMVQVYYEKPIFVADFANRHSDSLYFYCKISASPIMLLTAAVFAFKQYKLITAETTVTAQEKEN